MRIGVVMNKDSSTFGRRVNEESDAVFVEVDYPLMWIQRKSKGNVEFSVPQPMPRPSGPKWVGATLGTMKSYADRSAF